MDFSTLEQPALVEKCHQLTAENNTLMNENSLLKRQLSAVRTANQELDSAINKLEQEIATEGQSR